MIKNIEEITNKVFCGDAFEIIKNFPDNCIDMILTSPPYWSCRSYLSNDDVNKKFEIGLEEHPQEYINKIVKISKELMRVLKKSGSYFLNIGDAYYTATHERGIERMNKHFNDVLEHRIKIRGKYKENWLKQKGRLLIPFRVAIALQDEGFIIRNVIIWCKKLTIYPEKTSFGATVPYPAKDRFINAHEYIFHIVKSKKYYFDLDKVKIYGKETSLERLLKEYSNIKLKKDEINKHTKKVDTTLQNWNVAIRGDYNKVNPTDVIYFKKTLEKGNHFAKFPSYLAEFFILCGCPENGIVLDPFAGSGTVPITALKLNRKYIAIDINPEYVNLIKNKIKDEEIKKGLFNYV